MKTTTLVRFLSPLLFCVTWVFCAAKAPVEPTAVPLGDKTYSITREATNGFDRDVEKLRSAVKDDANRFCATQGKQLKIVSVTSEKPWFSTGFIKARIVFKALAPGEPEPVATSVTGAPVESLASGVDYYSDLLKLDDLRKRGILTDKEFEAEKKKILKHSN